MTRKEIDAQIKTGQKVLKNTKKILGLLSDYKISEIEDMYPTGLEGVSLVFSYTMVEIGSKCFKYGVPEGDYYSHYKLIDAENVQNMVDAYSSKNTGRTRDTSEGALADAQEALRNTKILINTLSDKSVSDIVSISSKYFGGIEISLESSEVTIVNDCIKCSFIDNGKECFQDYQEFNKENLDMMISRLEKTSPELKIKNII